MIDFPHILGWQIGQTDIVKAEVNGNTVWEKYDYTEPFYFENPDSNNSVTVYLNSQIPSWAPYVELYTSTDKVNWTNSYQHVDVPAGGKVYVRANTNYYTDSQNLQAGLSFRTGGVAMNVGGNIMSLLYGSNFTGNERTFPDNSSYVFYNLFRNWSGNCSNLILPATTLNPYCYAHMFSCAYGGQYGVCPPRVLPATTLAEGCYMYMFGDENYGAYIAYAPALPATTLVSRCYEGMFYNCSIGNYTPPELPATTLVTACYKNMFASDTQILPYGNYIHEIRCNATDISAADCTYNWVNGVAASGTFYKNANMSSWTTGANGIPTGWSVAGDIPNHVDQFYIECGVSTTVEIIKSDPNAPTISIEVSYDNNTWTYVGDTRARDYEHGVYTGLEVPIQAEKTYIRSTSRVPWATYDNNSGEVYYNYFNLSTGMNIHGNIMTLLGYDTLQGYDCYYMFQNGGTVTVPTLPATTLAPHCYEGMFRRCYALLNGPELPALTLAERCYYDMFRGCGSLQSISCNATDISASYCTYGWVTGVPRVGSFYKNIDMHDWAYSTGGSYEGVPETWDIYNNRPQFYLTNDDVNPITISIKKNDGGAPTVSLEISDDGATWTTLGDTSTTALSFTIPVGGEKYLRSISYNAWGNSSRKYNMFDSTGYFGAHGDIMTLLGYGTLKGFDCRSMFYNCSKLTTAPVLPATTAAEGCYYEMFRRCYALTTAPALPATTLTDSCYWGMFQECHALTTAPELPATTLSTKCYVSMFSDCNALTTAPILMATTLLYGSYRNMFGGCSSLTSITCNATSISVNECVSNWVNGVAASGTFYKNANMSSWTTGASGIPSGWTVQDIQ